jgi:hypothetical protein
VFRVELLRAPVVARLSADVRAAAGMTVDESGGEAWCTRSTAPTPPAVSRAQRAS